MPLLQSQPPLLPLQVQQPPLSLLQALLQNHQLLHRDPEHLPHALALQDRVFLKCDRFLMRLLQPVQPQVLQLTVSPPQGLSQARLFHQKTQLLPKALLLQSLSPHVFHYLQTVQVFHGLLQAPISAPAQALNILLLSPAADCPPLLPLQKNR